MAVAAAFVAFLILVGLAVYLHHVSKGDREPPPMYPEDDEGDGERLAAALQEIREKQIEDLKGG